MTTQTQTQPDPGAAPPANPDTPPAADPAPGGGQPPAWEMPPELAGQLPEDYHGKPPEEIIGGLLKENLGYRRTLSEKPKLPDDPAAYEFTPAEEIKAWFPEESLKDGPTAEALNAARQAAMKHGLLPDQFNGFINDIYRQMAEAKALPEPGSETITLPPIDMAQELKSFGEAEGLTDETEISRRHDELAAFGEAFVKQNKLPEASAGLIDGMTQTAEGMLLLSAMQKSLRERGFAPGGAAAPGGMTDAEAKALMRKPELTEEEDAALTEYFRRKDTG